MYRRICGPAGFCPRLVLIHPSPWQQGENLSAFDEGVQVLNQGESMLTYLTKTVGDMTIVYYKHPRLGDCHVAYYTE